MYEMKPLTVVPRSAQVSQMLDATLLSIEPRAQRVGVAVIAPRTLKPAELMVAGHFWPRVLGGAKVTRLAIVLGVESFIEARPIVAGCKWKFRDHGIELECFHEGHLESDQIRAWFEQRKPRRRVTTDTLVKLAERYTARGDVRAAQCALRIAESAAAAVSSGAVIDTPARTVAA